jgi:uncharacterized protein (TIGR03000 family)
MYSLVLMAALSGNAATPGCWFHHHCAASCCGCYGSCYGCSGSCYGCHGCWSSGWGCWSSGYSCYGSCYGGWGSCYGCHGCYGSYSYYTGCAGCYGSCYGSVGAYSGCYGCYGGYGYSDYAPVQVYPSAAPVVAPSAGPAPEAPREEPLPAPKKEEEKKGTLAPTRAKLTVELPPDARLYIDGRLMKTSSGRRSFATPTLQPGQLYFYEVRAEVTRDGKTSSDARRVIVRAGANVVASFDNLGEKGTATVRAYDR